MRGRGSTFT